MNQLKLIRIIFLVALIIISLQIYAHSHHSSILKQAYPLSTVVVKSEVTKLETTVPQIKPTVLTHAISAYNKARHQGYDKRQILTIIDYSLPDTAKRLWTFDLAHSKLLYHTLVAHGRESGDIYARQFSNNRNTKETSLGVFVTGRSYYGSDGYSLRLHGLSHGFNDNAYRRTVVIHGAWYVSDHFIKTHHRLGRSWGCPAVDKRIAKPFINKIKNGTLVFAYADNHRWLAEDAYLTT